MRLFLLGGLGGLFANFSKLGPDRSIDKKNLSGIQENADNLLTLISGIDTMQLYFVRDDV